MAIKRARYFDQQFLLEADFTDEQKYHLDMRRRLNRALHTFGIAEGLEVAKSGNKTVTVRPGTAIDRDGQEMIVETEQVIDLPVQFPAGATVFITIAYQEQETDPSKAGVSGNTRVTEQAIVRPVTAPPPTDGTVVRLASFTLDGTGNVPGNPNDTFDGGVRQTVSPKGGFGLSLDGVSNPGGNVDLFPGPGIAILPDQPNRRITIANQGLVSVDGVSNPGGNVDLVASPGQAIVITPDDANNRITIGESHSALRNNPHVVTAAQVEALALAGGTLTGNLQVNGNLGVNVAPETRLHVAGASPAVRIADGTQASGRVLVSDATGNAIWKQNSRYFLSRSLVASANIVPSQVPTPVKMGDFVVFSKASAESTIEVTLNSRVQVGGIAIDSNGAIFHIRIDDNKTTMANEAAISQTGRIEYLSIFAVFQGLAAGNHTVSVWMVQIIGTGPVGVTLDPGGFGGRIIVKETF